MTLVVGALEADLSIRVRDGRLTTGAHGTSPVHSHGAYCRTGQANGHHAAFAPPNLDAISDANVPGLQNRTSSGVR